tara:strand:- start:10 stop:144 length:135 start_codon:yes stop_codon:yes gene_type:complete
MALRLPGSSKFKFWKLNPNEFLKVKKLNKLNSWKTVISILGMKI